MDKPDRSGRLKTAAAELLECLRGHATHDDDVAEVLGFMEGFLTEIAEGKEMPPMTDPYGWYFYNSEAPLYEKLSSTWNPQYKNYQELDEAYLNFSVTLSEGF